MANIAIFRINYKSDFILTLDSDAGWMTPFCIKFWTGAPSQAYFAGYDGRNYTNCAPVDGEPTKLLVQFDDHHLPIGDLKFQIGYHFTVADFPTAVEDEVINQAAVIIDQDGTPMQVMLDLNGETAPEIQFSLPAYANEAQRIANEQQRIAAETQRIANEETRIANEQTRINQEQTRQQNEQQRINQEQARVNEYASLKADAVAATVAANDAAALANQKAQLAADKAALAQSAANLANAKAQLAADKAALAASAAQLANDKAALAQQKAEYAQEQGTYSKNQGDYAKEQGDYSKAQGDYAKDQGNYSKSKGDYAKDQGDYSKQQGDYAKEQGEICAADHLVAVEDHQTAAADHQTATTDHSTALSDHTQAGNDHTRAESDHTRAESDHDAVELYVDSLGVFDLSKHNAVGGVLATYADLDAALTALNALESKYKYGGMSFKFVQSFDNKYIRYNLLANSFTTDITQWAIDNAGVYVDNPEFVEVKLDAEGKILWAIKTDGSIYYGAGVPKQVKDYIEEKISSLSLDEYENIVTFLNDYLGSDTTLKAIIDEINATKVDKEEGKSLIDADYASTKSTIDNPDFLEVTTDSEDKVLEGIQADGTKVIGEDLNVGGSASINGDVTVKGSVTIDGTSYKVIENPEYVWAIIDNDDKILCGIKTDGKFVADIDGIDEKIQEAINQIQTIIDEAQASIDEKIAAIDEKFDFISWIEDPEGRSEITTDSEGRIISYRDSDGVKHEEVGIETDSVNVNHLNLTVNGMSEFQQALKDTGFQPGGAGNFSDVTELHIPEPYCARVNFTGIDSMPQTKTTDAHAYMEFYDMAGNYFKKEVIMNAQGRSTLAHPKKNIAIDICNNNGWDDDDTFSLQIGDWIPQDSFHLKAFYNDPFRCLSPVAYKLNDEILKTRGEHNDYVWKRALLDLGDITPTSTGCETAEDAIDGWNTNARCFPMGFPCIVYLNGEFYGIYSWQLKKHRDNYMMSKKKTKHIHLDGIISLERILNANGDTTKIWWTTNSPEGVEIRNPKPKKKKDGWDLVLLNGEKYDADANGGEIMSPTMIVSGEEVANPNWDSANESHVKSYEVKQYILNMSKIIPTLAGAYSTYEESAKTAEDKTAFKDVFEAYFDVDNLIDYLILSDVLANYDGFSQNVQWITYNGVKWYLCAYDMDGVMGNWWELNNTIVTPRSAHYDYAQFQYLPIFYNNELETRYKELRDKNIISVENISGLVEYWLKRIGAKETFDKEWEKWSGFIKNDNVHRLYKWLQVSVSNMDTLYHYNQN